MKIPNEATKKFIKEHQSDDVQKLALQFGRFANPEIDIPTALTQIAGKQTVKHKIPSWYKQDDLIYPVKLSLEQCSSETTAQYKSTLLSGHSFVDLTAGFGVDTAFISNKFSRTVSVDCQEELAFIARHNFSVLGLNRIQTLHADGVMYLKKMSPVDCIYLDPARRSGSGKKVMLIEDCEPNLLDIQDLLLEKADTVLIKLSPMLDINAALKVLKNVHAVHVVSVENECKELLFLLKKATTGEPLIHCVNCRKKGDQIVSFHLSEEKEAPVTCCRTIKEYLYEPHASILKAGFYKGMTVRYSVEKLHPDSHLYTSSQWIPDFPGRIFRVEAVSSLNKKDLKEFLAGIDKVHISTRNFPLPVEALRKKLKLKEGGAIYLFATKMQEKYILIKGFRG